MQKDFMIEDNIITAILIDGGFYRKRLNKAFGELSPQEAADQLEEYCHRHLTEYINGTKHYHHLYRIFYYDCPPSNKNIFNPITKKSDTLDKTPIYQWTMDFFDYLKKKRKFALRMGELSGISGYYIPIKKTKELLLHQIDIDDIKQEDLSLEVTQKGVDMRIGLDISSLAYKKLVDQIVLISGDSDFVPAAKLARREGIDFVLDPLGADVKDSLYEHIDGLNIRDNKFKKKNK